MLAPPALTLNPSPTVAIPVTLRSFDIAASLLTDKSLPTAKFPVDDETVSPTLNALYATISNTSPLFAAETKLTVDPSFAL